MMLLKKEDEHEVTLDFQKKVVTGGWRPITDGGESESPWVQKL